MLTFRSLAIEDAYRIVEVDRSEHVTLGYRYQDGELKEDQVDWHVPNWTAEGVDEFNLNGRIDDLKRKIDKGDKAIGAFDGDLLVGFTVLHERLTDDMDQISDLFVGREYRRKGIASRLLSELIKGSRTDGVKRLYVSAVPSESAVGFYRNQGFIPTEDVHPELFELEPEDIHMILEL